MSQASADDAIVAENFLQFLEHRALFATAATFVEEWGRLQQQQQQQQQRQAEAAVKTAASAATAAPTEDNGAAAGSTKTPAVAAAGSAAREIPGCMSQPLPRSIVVPEPSPAVRPSADDGEAQRDAVAELWDGVTDDGGFTYPDFPHGAGISRDEFERTRDDAVAWISVSPYLKEAPPASAMLESFDLRYIYEPCKTGFEDAKDFPIVIGSVIAGRYQVLEYLGSAAFSRAVQCLDLKHNHHVCVKIIRNTKDFFDQSLDEIKLLQLINGSGDADEHRVLQLFDYFYYKEHMFIVCELLRDNLYEFAKFNREQEAEFYFTLPRIQAIAKQVLQALVFVHSLNLIHSDLKPENILVKSYSRCEVKVIDFGSACFTTDRLSSYVQSRSYRAPEVPLGCRYDGRIDIWSLGAILVELMTGQVLFHADTLPEMLARIASICGPYPRRMLHEGRHTSHFVTQHGVFFERSDDSGTAAVKFHFAAPTSLRAIVPSDDPLLLDFLEQCLTVDPAERPTAQALAGHPFLAHDYGEVFSPPPPLKPQGKDAAEDAT